MLATSYIESARRYLEQLASSQAGAIRSAATLIADALERGGIVYAFGAGHSHLPVEELYPKCGNIVGFRPMVELALSSFTNVMGSNGIPQFSYLERQEGYAEAILQAHDLRQEDVLLVFSHSGVNGLAVGMATGARQRGLSVVAVTSVAHAMSGPSRHSSGKRLHEVADVTIDTGAPVGDAVIRASWLSDPIGPLSTLLAIAVANALAAQVAEELHARGIQPIVNPTLNLPGLPGAQERMDKALRSYVDLLARRSPYRRSKDGR